jgi:hypothetical protein
MEEPISKKEIINLIKSEREALDVLTITLEKEQMLQPGADTDWSVKDILAHVSVWEKRLGGWLAESLRGEVPQRPAPGESWENLDGMNHETFLENKDKPLEKVRGEFLVSHQDAMNVIAMLTDKELFDGDHFTWRNGDPMWHMIAANTWLHYREHREQIGKVLARQ